MYIYSTAYRLKNLLSLVFYYFISDLFGKTWLPYLLVKKHDAQGDSDLSKDTWPVSIQYHEIWGKFLKLYWRYFPKKLNKRQAEFVGHHIS